MQITRVAYLLSGRGITFTDLPGVCFKTQQSTGSHVKEFARRYMEQYEVSTMTRPWPHIATHSFSFQTNATMATKTYGHGTSAHLKTARMAVSLSMARTHS